MRRHPQLKTVLMVAYTNYESDARVIREAEAAVSGGYEIDFLALRSKPAPEEMIHGVRVIRLNQAKYRGRGHLSYALVYLQFFLRCFFRITALFFRRRYRVIHVNNMPDFLVFSAIIPKLLGAKVILDIHDPMPNTFASKFKSGDRGFFYRMLLWQERLSAWFADQVVTVHEPVKFGILEKHGLAADSMAVVANFADENLFKVQPSYPAFDGRVRLVYHGTILERSGLRTLIMALAQMRNREKIYVRIIGQGDFSAEFKRLIEQHGLSETVDFINRSYSHHEVPKAVADCHCGLVPLDISSATNYALPLKLVEYVCMGLPAIAVQNEAIKYYFGPEDCLYFNAGEAESLRAVLERVGDNPSMLLPFRERSLAIRGKFLWEPQKQKYIGILNRLATA